MGPAGCYKPQEFAPQPDPAKTTYLPDSEEPKDQENNSYTPGVGYYHSAYHAWFPYPFNYFLGGHGFYHGGRFHNSAYTDPVPPRSRPDTEAWARARASSRARAMKTQASSLHGGTAASPGATHGGSHSSGSIMRGGFGSGFHSFGG